MQGCRFTFCGNWLMWRDELIAKGTVVPGGVRQPLIERQRRWEQTPLEDGAGTRHSTWSCANVMRRACAELPSADVDRRRLEPDDDLDSREQLELANRP
jgi:hypothetical protein